MTWTYTNWILCNILIGFGIFFLTSLILAILLWRFDSVLYSIVSKLLNIERCIIGVHHQIIRHNSDIHVRKDNMQKATELLSTFRSCFRKTSVTNDELEKVLTNDIQQMSIIKVDQMEDMSKMVDLKTTDSDQSSVDQNESDQHGGCLCIKNYRL